jgi:hypothetical protein
LGFLGPWLFRFENADLRAWISLDFLGFSRQNPDFSMGYAAFSPNVFSSRFLPDGKTRRAGSVPSSCGNAGLFIGRA